MNDGTIELSKMRLEKAKQCIDSAKALIEAGDYRGAANRSYYAIFHSMRSVLALERKDFSKHSGVSSYFRKEYIRNGLFPDRMSSIVTQAFNIRNRSDYDDIYVISKNAILKQVKNAESFYEEIEKYLSEKLI